MSHKLLRLVVPRAVLVAAVTALGLDGPLRPALPVGLLAAFALTGLRAIGLLARSRVAAACDAFLTLNAAAVLGLRRLLRHGRLLPWT